MEPFVNSEESSQRRKRTVEEGNALWKLWHGLTKIQRREFLADAQDNGISQTTFYEDTTIERQLHRLPFVRLDWYQSWFDRYAPIPKGEPSLFNVARALKNAA